MSLNFKTVSDAVTAQAANRTVGSGRLVIKDGEIVRLRFIGGPGEPFPWDVHWVNNLRGPGAGGYLTCSHGWTGFTECVPCTLQPANPAIGAPSPRLSFTVILDRFMHVTEEGSGSTVTRKFFSCKKPQPCDLCASGNERKREGKRFWDMAVKHAQDLQEANRKLAKRCGSCGGVGLLSVSGHECASCGEPIQVPPEAAKVVCPGCREEVTITEQLTCSNSCAHPKRRTITDCWVEVRRIGGGTNTSYSYDPEPPSALEGDDAQVAPYDFRQQKRPKEAAEVAAQLGMKNPLAGADQPHSDGTVWKD